MQQGFQTGEKAAIALVVAMACFSASASATSPVSDGERLLEIEYLQTSKSGTAGIALLQPTYDDPESKNLTIAAGPTVTNPDPLFPTPAPYSAPPLTPPVSHIPVQIAPAPPTPQTAAPLPPVQTQQVPIAQAPQAPVAPASAPRPPQVAPVPPTVVQAVLPAGASLDMQPLIHAKNAGVALCLGTLARASTVAIDAEHEAFSTWATSAPDIHIFQSIAIMRYSNQVAPRSASVLLVAPTISNSCEGGTVQVIPSARPCSAIQGQLMQGSKAIANLSGVSVIENSSGVRQMLLPAPGNGCVMISVGIITGAAPQ